MHIYKCLDTDRTYLTHVMQGIKLATRPENPEDIYEDFPTALPECKLSTMLSLAVTPGSSGHDKFLRMLPVAFFIKAPRYWWAEFDTYKIGTTSLSSSTMNTIMKVALTQNNFVDNIPDSYLLHLNNLREQGNWYLLKQHLPESFIQTRLIKTNYATLKTIYNQRKSHKMPEWREFNISLLHLLNYPNLVEPKMENTI